MIDIHCHIIPNIDDGSKSMDETLKMAKRANELGYNEIFATPHYIRYSHENDCNEIVKNVELINELLNQKGINIKIYPGNEVYFSSELLEIIKNNLICTLGNTKYILVELPLNGTVFNMESVISNILNIGYVPIIAHPERYEFVHKDIKKLLPLIEEGALLQINIASISGVYGGTTKKTVLKLLKNDMVHFIGTDSHNSTSIYDVYEKSMKKIKKIVKEEKLKHILIDNPNTIVSDGIINIWQPKL